MRTHRSLLRSLLALLLVGLFAASCATSDTTTPAQDDTGIDESGDAEATDTESEPEATDDAEATDDTPIPDLPELELIERGPYTVGVTTITVTDTDRQRPLTVEVWFPVAPDTAGDPANYSFITGDYYPSPNAIAADPSAIATDQRFPLAIYTHGSGGLRFIDSNFTEMLASHGYVVAAADHTGNTAVELVFEMEIDTDQVLLDRPLDVSAVIDAMIDPANPDTASFAKAIDAESIAVAGHSLGGTTAFEVVAGFSNDYGTSPADTRVGAIVTFAPAVGDGSADALVPAESLKNVTVPLLIVSGTDDKTTPVDPNVETAWEYSASSPFYRVELTAAEHQSFTDMCAYQDWIPSLPAANPLLVATVNESAIAGCSADDMPIDRVKDLTNTFVISFLDSIFRGTVMPQPDSFSIPDDLTYRVR
jgi:predicted dienelactone hydrolase